MKCMAILCLLAFAAADEDGKNIQDKKSQSFDAIQNTSSSTQSSLLNKQVFPPTSFSNVFGSTEPVSTLAYTGYNGNVSPIQTINPDFFGTPATGVVNTPIQAFPITRAFLPGTSPVISNFQPTFPVAGNVFPAAQTVQTVPAVVNSIPPHFQGVGAGILTSVPGVSTGTLDANTAVTSGAVPVVLNSAYRFLTPEAIASQGLQSVQQVGLAAIPAFTSGILPSLSNGVLQGQNIPSAIQQILKNPNNTPAGISDVTGLATGNISSGPLTSAFRNA